MSEVGAAVTIVAMKTRGLDLNLSPKMTRRQEFAGEAERVVPWGGELAPLSAAERQELVELRRRLKQIQLERDILARATSCFVSANERTSTTPSNA